MKDNTDRITEPFRQFISNAYKISGLLNNMVPPLRAKDIILKHLDSFHESLRHEARAELSNKIAAIRSEFENIVQGHEANLRGKYPLLKGDKVYSAEIDKQGKAFEKKKDSDKLLKSAPEIIRYFDDLQTFLFTPNMEGIEKFIMRDRIDDFIENENTLHKEGFINNSGKWNFDQGKFVDWQCYISLLKKRFLIPDKDYRGPDRFRIEDMKKQWWADRYGYPNKNYLKDSKTSEQLEQIEKRLHFLIIPEKISAPKHQLSEQQVNHSF